MLDIVITSSCVIFTNLKLASHNKKVVMRHRFCNNNPANFSYVAQINKVSFHTSQFIVLATQ